MSVEKVTDSFSFQLGSSPVAVSPNDAFLAAAHNLVFPFLFLKLKSDPSLEDGVVEVKVNPKVYDFLKNGMLTDELSIYCQMNGQLGLWTYDMIISMKILSDIGILGDIKNWVLESRKSIRNLLSAEKVESIKQNQKALEITKEILSSLNILNEVQSSELLFLAAKDVISTKEMDPNTIIYRLTMATYHSKQRSGTSIVKSLDEPSTLYLKLSQSEIINKYNNAFKLMMDLPPDARIRTTKILIAFLIGAFAYYESIRGNQ